MCGVLKVVFAHTIHTAADQQNTLTRIHTLIFKITISPTCFGSLLAIIREINEQPYVWFLMFISLMMVQYEPKHIGDMVLSINKVFLT